MARKALFNPDQVAAIRASRLTNEQLAEDYNTSALTISRVRNFKGAYRSQVLEMGSPILNAHGQVVGVTPTETTS